MKKLADRLYNDGSTPPAVVSEMSSSNHEVADVVQRSRKRTRKEFKKHWESMQRKLGENGPKNTKRTDEKYRTTA